MQTTVLLMFMLAVAAIAFGQDQQFMGIQVGDLNRSGDPCTDFYEFANGSWRANNPIPASMTRWSRRFAAGDAIKGQLKEILEQAIQEFAEKGSTMQLIGDYYAACMNEEQI